MTRSEKMKALWADPAFRKKQKESLAHRRPRGEVKAEREERKHRRIIKCQLKAAKRRRPRRSMRERQELKRTNGSLMRVLAPPMDRLYCNGCQQIKPGSNFEVKNDDGTGICFACYFK